MISEVAVSFPCMQALSWSVFEPSQLGLRTHALSNLNLQCQIPYCPHVS
jgi:hypothetical protein